MQVVQSGSQTTLTLNDDEVGTILQALTRASQELMERHVPDCYFGPMAEELAQRWRPIWANSSSMGTF